MENAPQNIIAIGRKRFPIEEIALVEPFQPPAEPPPRFTSDKEFKARVVLIDRYSVLTEDTVEAFAEANKFRLLPDVAVATNPAVRFRIETFGPSEGFDEDKKFRLLPDDAVAPNPAVRFRIETFEPSEGFEPRKAYQSRSSGAI